MSDATATVRVEIRDDIAILALDNPARRNALSPGVRSGMIAETARLVDDPAVRAIVVTGRGGHFSSGGDISQMRQMTLVEARRALVPLHGLVRTMIMGGKPFVAAVEGVAFGAGFSLALACDQIVASRDARFCASFSKVNLIADGGMLWTLPQRVGMHKARELITLAVELDADRAERLGIVDRVTEPGGALEAAVEVARRYAEVPPTVAATLRTVFADGSLGSLEGVLRAEADHQSALRTTEDHRNAIAAFFEKRKPVFTGR